MRKQIQRGVYGLYSFGHSGRIEFSHSGIEVFDGKNRTAMMGWKKFKIMCERFAPEIMNPASRKRCVVVMKKGKGA